MPTFTVHARPSRNGERAPDPQCFLFVRDGFYFWAFVLAPLWLLWHRLWLALLGYLLLDGLTGGTLYLGGAPEVVGFLVGLVIALLIGFEAATLWRWTLRRRGWTMLGFAVADHLESAEQRFFSAWAEQTGPREPETVPPPQAQPVPLARRAPPEHPILGLFPQPEGNQ
jgi:hypothetical protein